MKKGSSVSKAALDSAVIDTQAELALAGFWNEGSRLLKTEVHWCLIPNHDVLSAGGFFYHDHPSSIGHLLGFEVGHIYIPKWIPWPWGTWEQERGSLRDYVRHEYGHALAHYYPKLIQQGPQFRAVFGKGYWSKVEFEYDPEFFVTQYAAEKPMEDFCETFMVYLRSRGSLPASFGTPSIKRKWKFIRDLGRVVASGGSRW